MSASTSAVSAASGAGPKHNLRSTAVKRILQEHRQLLDDPSEDFRAEPLDHDIFEWHVTVRGVAGSEYEGGIYHLRVVLPSQYPMKAPDIMLMTPSGRFQTNTKVCIDGLTSFHESSWRPAWGVKTAVVGLRSFWCQRGVEAESGIGGMTASIDERKRLAKLSTEWVCPTCCRSNAELMKEHDESLAANNADREDAAAQSSSTASDAGAASVNKPKPSPQQDVHVEPATLQGQPTTSPVPPVVEPTPSSIDRIEQPRISATARFLLTAPSWPLFRLIHFYLASLLTLLPGFDHHRPHLPAEPDDVVYLDAAMHAFLIVIAILLVGKVYRNWDRWVILVVGRAGAVTQRLFGFGLGVDPSHMARAVAGAGRGGGGRAGVAAARPTLRRQGRVGRAQQGGAAAGVEPAAQPLNPPHQAPAAPDGNSPIDLHLLRARERAEQL